MKNVPDRCAPAQGLPSAAVHLELVLMRHRARQLEQRINAANAETAVLAAAVAVVDAEYAVLGDLGVL